MATTVIFRKWANGNIIALFPEIPADAEGRTCQSYEHIGQHGAADIGCVMSATVPATPEEYGELLSELIALGHNDLIACSRLARRMTTRRLYRAMAQRLIREVTRWNLPTGI